MSHIFFVQYSLRAEKAGSISPKLQMRTLRHRGPLSSSGPRAVAASTPAQLRSSVGGGSQKAERRPGNQATEDFSRARAVLGKRQHSRSKNLEGWTWQVCMEQKLHY